MLARKNLILIHKVLMLNHEIPTLDCEGQRLTRADRKLSDEI